MKKLTLMAVFGVSIFVACNSWAGISYWDPNGATVVTTGTVNGTWENNLWTGTSTPTGSTVAYTEGNLAAVTANAGSLTINATYNVTANANHTIGGIYNGGLTDGTVTNLQVKGTGILSIAAAAGGQGFWGGSVAAGNMTINSVLAGTGGVQTQGSGSIFLWGNNTYSGGTYINTGAGINFNNNNSFGTGVITNWVSSAVWATPAKDGGGNSTGASSALTIPNAIGLCSTNTGTATTIIVGNASAPITFTGNVNLGSPAGSTQVLDTRTVAMTFSGVISGAANVTKATSSGTLTFTGVNTYTGNTTINSGCTLTIGGAGQLGSGNYSGTIANAGSLFYSSSANQTLGGVVSGAGTLYNTGSGTLTLTAANTFTGGISNASSSTLTIGSAGTLAAQPLTNNGTFTYASSANNAYNAVVSGTGRINITSGVLQLTGANTYTGKVTVNGGGVLTISADAGLGAVPGGVTPDDLTLDNGTLRLGTTANTVLSANRGITLGAGGGTIDLQTVGTAKSMDVQGVISGSGALTKAGTTTLTNTGANTYTGKTTISQGTIVALTSINKVVGGSASSSLGAPTTVANGTISMGGAGGGTGNGTLIYKGAGETTDRVIDLAGTTGNATIQNDGTGALVFSSDITVTGGGLKTFTLQGSSTAANTFSGKIIDGSSPTILAKGGAGTWNITGVNTYTGGTLLNSGGGLLNIGNASALGTGNVITAGNSTFDNTTGAPLTLSAGLILSNGSPTYIGSANDMTFNGASAIYITNRTITVNAHTLTIAGGFASDVLPVGHNFTKAGAGKLVLGGTSAFTGTNFVNAGTEQVDGDITTAATVIVTNGATLSGNGKLPSTTVANAGSINPGASPGSLSVVGTLTLASGSTNVIEINDPTGTAGSNPGWDSINCNALAITGATRFKVNSLTGTSSGPAANFNNTTDYDMVILHATNGISTGDLSLVILDYSDFTNLNTFDASGIMQLVAVTNGNVVDIHLQYGRFPVITVQPVTPVNANHGDNVSFSTTVTGSTSTYQWKKGAANVSNGNQIGGSFVSGATSTTLNINGVSFNDESTAYTLVVKNPYGTATSSAATLTVFDPPVVTDPTSPATVVKDAGQNFTLTVQNYGRTPTTYQWKHGGANLANGSFDNAATVSGSQTATLLLTGVRAADAGDYTAALTNSDGGTISVATTLQVVDPAITQQPVASTFECGTTNSLSVTAIGTTNADGNLYYQWFNGDLNSSTLLTDKTNASLTFSPSSFTDAGSYFVIVTNALNNTITSSVVVVTVEDTNAPTITVLGPTQTLECHVDTFVDSGATASDSCDGTLPVTTNNPVNVNAAGTYTVTYSATDSHANTGYGYLVVIVQDTVAPTITMNGSASTTISCGNAYVDAGASASDLCAGDIAALLTTNYGTLNISAPVAGDYTITFTAHDPSGNNATPVTRAVHVIDNTPPMVTLNGDAVVTNECHTAFNDPGVSANDLCAGNVSNSVQLVSILDTNLVGVYTLTYTADDGAGNSASVTRIVHVEDHTPPTLTLAGNASMSAECHVAWIDPGATASDDCSGTLTSQIAIDYGALDTNSPALGTYTVTYTVADGVGNTTASNRVVTVSDTLAPVINVNPSASTVQCHTSYADAGATADDTCAGNLNSQISTDLGGINTSSAELGTYTVTYTVSDGNGHTTVEHRVITVIDTIAPFITMNGTDMGIECHSVFNDPGASVTDSCDGSPLFTTNNPVQANNPGTYTITYTATDASNNSTNVYRVVTVTDTLPPEVTVNGTDMTVECHSGFTDPGATAFDACELTVAVSTNNPVNADQTGTYTITYTACDSGNRCQTKYRVVTVSDSQAPAITVTPSASTIECHGGYTDAGATASDGCSGTLDGSVTSNNPVNADIVGTYTVTYTVSDATGNAATNYRAITVLDTVAPSITLTNGDVTIECKSAFTDPGYSASDDCAGDLTGSVAVDVGGLNTSSAALGTYTITYTVSDPTGNSTTNNRVVTVTDTQAPQILIVNGSPTAACLGHPYTDDGATASDDCAGDLTGSIITTSDVNTNASGTYHVTYVVTDPSGNSATNTRTVVVSPCDLQITTPLASGANFDATDTATVSLTAESPSPITYQWYKRGTGTNYTAVSNQTTNTLTIPNILFANQGSYFCLLQSGPNTLNSGDCYITVNDPVIKVQPVGTNLSTGFSAPYTMNVGVRGTAPILVQWKFLSATAAQNTPAKALTKFTGNTNLVISAKLGNAGTYWCLVTNTHIHKGVPGSSAQVPVVIYSSPKVSATAIVKGGSKYVGNNALLKATASPTTADQTLYGGPLYYVWGKTNNGVFTPLVDDLAKYPNPVSGIHNFAPTLSINDLQLQDSGTYTCVVSNSSAVVVASRPAVLTVNSYTTLPVVVTLETNELAKVVANNNQDNNQVVMSGRASDLGRITSVWMTQNTNNGTSSGTTDAMPSTFAYRSNGLGQITGSVLWTNTVLLAPGTNAFLAYAQNELGSNGYTSVVRGGITNPNPRHVFYLVATNLTLLTNGPGTVTATAPAQLKLVATEHVLKSTTPGITTAYQGIAYVIKATPAMRYHLDLVHPWTDENDIPLPYTGNPITVVIPPEGLKIKAHFLHNN